ncbi:MAG: hypothetical protein A3B68_06885 [Candidatus Melainabacteria bacterium RIFCSPHIGHO2_02_FULL_34_12]|nr:MAG: hypothetical protein A3B68_06885 [Candidatus Melainabacteria bacterium RIFCSPHIGHO2_02_FULL_34_12]
MKSILKNSLILIISLLFVFFLYSCSFSPKDSAEENSRPSFGFDRNLREIKVYFLKSLGKDELKFVTATRKIPKEDSVIAGTLKELFLGPTKKEEIKGIMTEIPVGTRLIKVEESEDDILVDVSSQYVTGGGAAAMQLRYLQIYKTLKKIAPHKKIYFHVDGKIVKSIGGEGLEVTQPLTKINDYTEINEKSGSVQP